MTTGYVSDGKTYGWISSPTARYWSNGAAWRTAYSRFVMGPDMQQKLAYTNQAVDTSGTAPHLDEMQMHAGPGYMGSLTLKGLNFQSGLYGGNPSGGSAGADWTFSNTTVDHTGNFSAAETYASPQYTFLTNNAWWINQLANQTINTPSSGGTLKMVDLIGYNAPQASSKNFVVSINAILGTLPGWVWYFGDPTNGYIGLYAMANGALALYFAGWTGSGNITAWATAAGQVQAGAMFGACLLCYPSTMTGSSQGSTVLWINGAAVAFTVMPGAGTIGWPTNSTMSDQGYLGYSFAAGTTNYFSRWHISWNMADPPVAWSSIASCVVTFTQGANNYPSFIQQVSSDTQIGVQVPNVADGAYTVAVTNYAGTSRSMPFQVASSLPILSAFTENWSNPAEVATNWMCAHYSWSGQSGAGNNGTCWQNVAIQNGVLTIEGHGLTYSGPVNGTDLYGNTVAATTKVGGALVSKGYMPPGMLTVVMKMPPLVGASAVAFPFHYEEIYRGDARYAAFAAAGFTEEGNINCSGFYRVRNQEIDIAEWPHDPLGGNAAQTNCVEFNSWVGDVNGTYELHTQTLSFDPTAAYHTYQMEWVTSGVGFPTGWVKFWIDGVLMQTCTTYVPTIPMRIWLAYWFPNLWAGTPNWNRQQFLVQSVAFTPYAGQSYSNIPETYPSILYRAFNPNNKLAVTP